MDETKANTWPVVDFPNIVWVDAEAPQAIQMAARYRAQKEVLHSFKYMLLHNETAPLRVRLLSFLIGIMLTWFFYDWLTTSPLQWAWQMTLMTALFIAVIFHYTVFIVMQRAAYAGLSTQYRAALTQHADCKLVFNDDPAWKCLQEESRAYTFSDDGTLYELAEIVRDPIFNRYVRDYLLAVTQIPETNRKQMAQYAHTTLQHMRRTWYEKK